MKKISQLLLAAGIACSALSCSTKDFLDAQPKDALSPGSTWKTEGDAHKFLIGLYDGWDSGYNILYMDCTSDFGFNFHRHEGWRVVGDGSMTTASPGLDFYHFGIIRRANTLLQNIEGIKFADQAAKDNIIAQARLIRAYNYFKLMWHYGGVPIIDNYTTAEEARVPAKSEAEVRAYVEKEMDEAIAKIAVAPAARGYLAKGAALAMRMRLALYYEDYATAKAKAEEIIALGQYQLESNYANLFNLAGQDSKEIIAAVQHLKTVRDFWLIGAMLNNGAGGWSSIVPTANLVNTYEMKDGLTIDDPNSGYDPIHPFKDRDPRMAMTVLFPGADYPTGGVYNTLDKEINGVANEDFMTKANNSSRTGLSWRKYVHPSSQYADVWDTSVSPIVFRYAEVLLTWAEAENELKGPSAGVYEKLNMIRNRVGMPEVDRRKYATKETLRELIRRERAVELAGEGLRRADILRWKDANGKMVAETVLNGRLERMVGTVNMAGADPETRATINTQASPEDKLIETRVFKPYMRYLPMSQNALDKNPKLKPTPGY